MHMNFAKIAILCLSFLISGSLSAEEKIRNGSLIFLKNSNRWVQSYTKSEITHVAIVINIDGESWVYEACKPRVRKTKLEDYYEEIREIKEDKKKLEFWICKPEKEFTKPEMENMKLYLDSQLKRKYSINSFIAGKPQKGIHCAEMVINALAYTGRAFSNNSCEEAPKDVWKKTDWLYPIKLEVIQ